MIKTCTKLMAFLFLSFFASSCLTKEILETPNGLSSKKIYTVSITDVISYTQQDTHVLSKSSNTSSIDIQPIIDASDTLMYCVNYEHGWVLLSSDKRTPQVIAYGESGRFDLENAAPGLKAWINSVKGDLKRIRYASNDELSFSSEEIEQNLSKWNRKKKERANPGEPTIWIVTDTIYYSEPVQQIMHLVPAQWDQNAPYNHYCPIQSGTTHYYVGCAGIAGGSMLHYLSKKHGFPTTYSGVPIDSIGVNYSSYLTDSTRVTARFLKAVNDSMNMNYTSNGSYAFPSDVEDFFDSVGYPCTYSSFSATTVAQSILQNKPVMVLAFDSFIGVPLIWEGHYFLIDGYQTRHDVVLEHTYYDGSPGAIIPSREIYNYLYISPEYLQYVKMNWGWWDQWISGANDGWYALTASWITNNGTYDSSRQMFYGFE